MRFIGKHSFPRFEHTGSHHAGEQRRGAQHEPKFFRIYDPRETFIFLYNGAAETCNRICKQIYRYSPLWQVYRWNIL